LGKTMTTKSRTKWGVVLLALLVVVIGYACAKVRERRQEEACLRNLMMIDSAKTSAALQKGLVQGQPLSESDVIGFFRNAKMPPCPSGGDYILEAVGQYPYCTIHGYLQARRFGTYVVPDGLKRKEDAQPATAPYSEPAARSPQG
jgi:hypothetical protein